MDRSLASKYNKVRASRVNEQNWSEYAHERKTEAHHYAPGVRRERDDILLCGPHAHKGGDKQTL